jgi:hypothetical protein
MNILYTPMELELLVKHELAEGGIRSVCHSGAAVFRSAGLALGYSFGAMDENLSC